MRGAIQSFWIRIGLAVVGVGLCGGGAQATPPQIHKKTPTVVSPMLTRVDYDRDVRPILSENCFKCHGFDPNQRQAGLRLDTAEGAYKLLASGAMAVKPGSPAASALIQRVLAGGAMHMPPVSTGKKVTAAQITVLKQWIAQGGKYDPHWSFVPPKRPALPTVKNAAWAQNPIDRFILARLEKEGLKPSPQADRITLIRRLSFDLTGLPPTPSEVDAFVNDKSKDAYEKVVDRLLASPHYGERMAVSWLDLARYADTHGFHIDSQRDMWRWREWVIDAYNHNLPYDQFVLQQLAGDLLPNATLDQRIASGFNRNHPINFEGGAIPEEYANAYIVDRIDTTATAFMGLTMRCAQCHDHKYDPITQKDYYRFYALFHNVAEQGLDGQTGNAVPYLKAPDAAQQAQLDAANQRLTAAQQALKTRTAEAQPALTAWVTKLAAAPDKMVPVSKGLVARYPLNEGTGADIHNVVNNVPVTLSGKPTWASGRFGPALVLDGTTTADLGTKTGFERTDKFSYGAWVNPASMEAMTVLSCMDEGAEFRGFDLYISGGQVFVHLIHTWDKNAIRVNTKPILEANKWTHLFVTYDGSSKAKGITVYVNGKPMAVDITHDTLTDSIQTTVPLRIGRRSASAPFKGMLEAVRIYQRQVSAEEVEQIADFDTLSPIFATPDEKRTPEQRVNLTTYYLTTQDEPYRRLTAELAAAQSARDAADKAIPTTMVMQEMDKSRDTFLLMRGQYDKPGEKVQPGTPDFLPPLPAGQPVNRLTMARWLIDPSHPLTARVAVNRYWQMLFGTGLVKTAEDFGTQGERPSHPELFDWLATEYIGSHWDTKALLRLLVTSTAYRQSSKVTPFLKEHDPENRLLARGPRYRLQAEFVRDQALAVSGLLVEKVGGPSVHPYQPTGLWEEIAFGGSFSAQTYVQDHGENLYRRGMYTFWKRTCPPPSLQAFDAPEREFCLVRRSVTNTPLQALTLMNDPTYVEASRKFAERIMKEGGATPEERIAFAYRLALSRKPKFAESQTMLALFNQQAVVFRLYPSDAMKLLSVGESKRDETLNPAELAAWSTIASVLLNLDETITKG